MNPVDEALAPSPGDDEQRFPWRRVHPATPYLRGWLAIVVILFAAARQWFDGLFSPEGLSDISRVLPWIVGGSLAVLVVVVGLFYLSWRFTRFRVTDTQVQLRTGVISRKQSDARLDRVQAVDIGRPLLPRLLGLSELRFEVADGGKGAFRLQFLGAAEAERLRAEILRLAAGARAAGEGQETGPGAGPGDAATAPPAASSAAASRGHRLSELAGDWAQRTVADLGGENPYGVLPGGTADERVLVEVPAPRLIGSIALELAPWLLLTILAPVLLWAVPTIVSDEPPPALWPIFLGLLVPAFFGIGARAWSRINAGFGFRAASSSDGLRLRHGLTDTQHRTVPPGRVQAVLIRRPLLWRPFGWVRMEANVAGYGASLEDGAEARSVLLPVGTFAEAITILATVLPDPGTDDALGLLERGLDGAGSAGSGEAGAHTSSGPGGVTAGPRQDEFVTTPRSARWLAPLAWRRQGFAVTRTALVLRTGRLSRRLVLVPHARTQGLRATQGWLARLCGVATVSVATTAGPVPTTIQQIDARTASELVATQVQRASDAAHREDRNHWLGAEAARRGGVAVDGEGAEHREGHEHDDEGGRQ